MSRQNRHQLIGALMAVVIFGGTALGELMIVPRIGFAFGFGAIVGVVLAILYAGDAWPQP